MSDARDPYEILQIRREATDDVVRAAFRALARRHHPDSSPDGGSSAEMAWINWAWEILGNPQRRSAYDRERRNGGEPPSSPIWTHGPGDSASTAATPATGSRPDAQASPSPAPGSPAGAQPGGWSDANGRAPILRRAADGRVIEWRNAPDGTGGAGPPPGRPSGTILPFGRFIAWSIGEIVRHDPGYLDWLDQRPEGAPYRDEIDQALRRLGWRQGSRPGDPSRRWGR
jgi:curved DNA-binding protein CbpA